MKLNQLTIVVSILPFLNFLSVHQNNMIFFKGFMYFSHFSQIWKSAKVL